MPPKVKITKEDILKAALDLLRQSGETALCARGLAAALGSSTQPIFSNFATMDELRLAVGEKMTLRFPHYTCEAYCIGLEQS